MRNLVVLGQTLWE